MTAAISIKQGHDPAALAREYARNRRIQIADFLEPADADRLHDAFRANQSWYLAYLENGQAVECPQASLQQLTPPQRQQFLGAIHQQAAEHFQYCFLQYYVSEAIGRGENPGHPLHAAHAFVNGDGFLDFMRSLTGVSAIRSADVLASCYTPGHFLTVHDDTHHGRDRVAAYVISLTRSWNCNWGGHLAFFDEQGDIEAAYAPTFNALHVFDVPRRHAVQLVAPFARGVRTSLTGWVHR